MQWQGQVCLSPILPAQKFEQSACYPWDLNLGLLESQPTPEQLEPEAKLNPGVGEWAQSTADDH